MLVKQLAIKGWIVTIDAMETQTKIAERIIEFEGDNVLTESFKLIVFRSGQSAGNMVQLGYTK